MLRAVRDPIGTPGFQTRQIPVVTTRLAPERSPVTDLAEWSRQRWHIATSLAHLKTTRPRDVLHGHTVPGVRKDWTGFARVDTLVRMGMGHSAMRQRINVERISFLEALRWLGAPHTGLSRMALMVHPKRPPRVEPCVKPRRPKRFPCMLTPRPVLRQPLVQHELSGSLHASRVMPNFMPFGADPIFVTYLAG